METQSASVKRSAEQKLVGTLGEPKCKCKKGQQNKNSGTNTVELK